MAKHLARIHGTEEDKVNCPFYFKIGACRHSDRCSRLHHKPAFSQTLLFPHLYQAPPPANASPDYRDVDHFLDFLEDVYMEVSKFGRLEGLYVADNVGDHLIGHVYAKFWDEEDATDCLHVMDGRYYDGRPIAVEYSPVMDFREARCRDFDEGHCQRGGYCNFLHVKPVPRGLLQSLEEEAEADRRRQQQSSSHKSSSSSSKKSKKKRRREHKDDDHYGDYDNDKDDHDDNKEDSPRRKSSRRDS